MKCANPACGVETLYLRSGGIYGIDFLDGTGVPGEGQIILRRVIWLCDACTGNFAIETWRPPGEQMRPSRRLQRETRTRTSDGAPPEAWN
ncbi:MAG TPA: hypothetical protein VHX60_19060 [Acidobacteriaceae bacterium]|jgi:hypothetical protein|nr:hypothetical protein [Acidobacteriaceae bacterium]